MKIRTSKRLVSAAGIFALSALTLAIATAVNAEPFFQVPMINSADMSRYDSNYIELGGLYNSQDSFKHGEWTGITDENGYAVGNFNWLGKDPEKAYYWNVWGYNLGLESRQLGGNLGTQGQYGLKAEYQGIPHYLSDSAKFIYDGLGGSDLVLPSSFPGINGQPPANAATLADYQRQYDVKQRRDIYKISGNLFFGGSLEALVNYRYDKRDGTNMTGLTFGAGSDPRAVFVPYPVDDNTQQVEAKLRWTTDKAQLEAGYYYSRYSNSTGDFTWQNAYMNPGSWDASAGFPGGYGRTSLMPDNDYHQFRLSGGYSLPFSTRITGIAAYGMSRQNESFTPYTINNIATDPLPRDKLDAKVDNTLLNLNVTSRPLGRLMLKARYRYNDYNNKTPTDVYNYVQADSYPPAVIPPGGDTTSVNSTRLRHSHALSKTENQFDLDATYPFPMGMSLRGYYGFKRTAYSPSEDMYRDNTNDNTFGLELRKRASTLITGSLKYEFQQRRGSVFDQNRIYEGTYTPGTTEAGIFENLTLLRQFYAADYDQNKIKALVSLTPADAVTLSFSADWAERQLRGPDCGSGVDQVLAPTTMLDHTCMGRTKATMPSYTIDGQWTPIDGISAYAFYTWSQAEFDQLSRSMSNHTTHPSDQTRNWGANLKSTDNTFGIGARYVPEERNFDIGIQYVFDYGKSALDSWAGSSLAPSVGVPDATYRLHQAQLYGSYQWNKNIKLRAGYVYERLKGKDWAYDGSDLWSSNNVVGPGMVTDNYVDNLVYLTIAYVY